LKLENGNSRAVRFPDLTVAEQGFCHLGLITTDNQQLMTTPLLIPDGFNQLAD